MPGIVVHFHFHQHIAGKKLPLGNAFLAHLEFDHFLHRHQDTSKRMLHGLPLDTL